MKGIITKATGSWYSVRTAEGSVWNCRIKGRFRLQDERLNNPVAVGDEVSIEPEKTEGQALISEITPRRNYVLRSSTRRRHQLHLIAANLDQVMLVATIIEPNLKPGFLDRYLLTTEAYNIPSYLVFNKADIYGEAEMAVYEAVRVIYEALGYTCLLVSTVTGQGVEELKAQLKDKRTLISGTSGVGKSSLVNAIQPQLDQRTGDLSGYTGKGKHTTTFAELFELDFGGELIDTPGIKELGFINLTPQDVAHNYREFFEFSAGCHFKDCLHLNEPNCAVRKAINEGKISELRYNSYLSVMEEVQSQNYWERKKM